MEIWSQSEVVISFIVALLVVGNIGSNDLILIFFFKDFIDVLSLHKEYFVCIKYFLNEIL